MPSNVKDWSGKIEGVDYVVCRHCGHKAVTLVMHLKFAHKTNAEEYYTQFPGAPMRSSNCVENRSAAISQARKDNPTKGATKMVSCRDCKKKHKVSRFAQTGSLCRSCTVQKEEADRIVQEAYWASRAEGEEYVKCVGCSYRAENLTSHIQNAHPEWVGSYPGQTVALNSAVRDKSHIKGKTLPLEVRQKMSRNAGKWNKGHTKLTHPSMASVSEKRMGQSLISLNKDVLTPFLMKNGKVLLRAAKLSLGVSHQVLKRECVRHGMSIFNRLIGQTICLNTVSEALGCVYFKAEWSSPSFVNPRTGHKFRYDGYFPDHDLIVEFHGYHHYTFPSVYVKDVGRYFDLQERDRIKENLIHADPKLKYFLLREDEPYFDVGYIRGKLIDEGVSIVFS